MGRQIARMGAWDDGPLSNDTAADWADAFDGADRDTGLQVLTDALNAAAETGADEYLDSDVGCEAVAAAELVAAMRGVSIEQSAYNEAAVAWLATATPAPTRELVTLAVRALERVAAPNSELAELWQEAGVQSWRDGVDRRLATLRR